MVFDYVLGILGVLAFIVVVIIPWILGVGEILDAIKKNNQIWRYK